MVSVWWVTPCSSTRSLGKASSQCFKSPPLTVGKASPRRCSAILSAPAAPQSCSHRQMSPMPQCRHSCLLLATSQAVSCITSTRTIRSSSSSSPCKPNRKPAPELAGQWAYASFRSASHSPESLQTKVVERSD